MTFVECNIVVYLENCLVYSLNMVIWSFEHTKYNDFEKWQALLRQSGASYKNTWLDLNKSNFYIWIFSHTHLSFTSLLLASLWSHIYQMRPGSLRFKKKTGWKFYKGKNLTWSISQIQTDTAVDVLRVCDYITVH